MPKMGGTQLADRLAGDYPQLKFLFMTGYANDPSITASTQRHVLFKPFQSMDLLGKIREVLGTPEIVPDAPKAAA